jgi:hypothetical protein
MSSENNNIEFFSKFTKNILNSHKSIRWVGITDQNGVIFIEEYREGLKLLLTKEEIHESAINSVIRQRTRIKFEPKIGKLTYAFGRYENLSRFIIPINENYYLLVHMDFKENNFDNIIMEKILPLIQKEKEEFVIKDKKE